MRTFRTTILKYMTFAALGFHALGCATVKEQKPEAFVLLSSDAPESRDQYAQTIIDGLMKTNSFSSVKLDLPLEKQWHKAAILHEDKSAEARTHFVRWAQILRSAYFGGKRARIKPEQLNAAMTEGYDLISSSYEPVIDYSEFLFWVAVHRNRVPSEMHAPASIYAATAGSLEARRLEANVNPNVLNKIYMAGEKMVPIKFDNKDSCKIFVNGRNFTGVRINLPTNVKSIVTADCKAGRWSRTLLPSKANTVAINPIQYDSFAELPDIDQLDLRDAIKPNVLFVFVHLSQERSAISVRAIDQYRRKFALKTFEYPAGKDSSKLASQMKTHFENIVNPAYKPAQDTLGTR